MDLSIAMIVRVEEDSELSEIHRRFHLNAGVDVILTPEVPVTADWVIESGPDEFWWPRGGSLKDVLASVPAHYDALKAVVRHFVPVAGEGSFPERMIYRLAPQAPIGDEASPWRPVANCVRRAMSTGRTLKGWHPIEVLHFPVYPGTDAYRPEQIESALGDGILRLDTRFRDALRVLDAGAPLRFPHPDALDEAEFALDIAVLGEADVIRAHKRLDALEERLAAAESTFPAIIKRKLRALVGATLGRRGKL